MSYLQFSECRVLKPRSMKRVANATGNVRIYNQVLFVEVPSPALRNNLFMQRKQLVKKINALVKSDVVTDIMFK